MPPTRLCTTCIWHEEITRALPRLTSTRNAKYAQMMPTTISAMVVPSRISESRGVFCSAAARTSFAKEKSELRMGRRGFGIRIRLGRLRCRLVLQPRDDEIARTVGFELALFEYQKTVDQREQR